MQNKLLTGEALEKALKDDSLTRHDVTLVGMVKSGTEDGFISFTQTDCGSWIDIPTQMIEEAELVGRQSCKDHTHPIMSITLKEPKNPEARVLYALLAQQIQSGQIDDSYAAESDSMPDTADIEPHHFHNVHINRHALSCTTRCLDWGICRTPTGLKYRCCKKWGLPPWCVRGLRPPRFYPPHF